MKLFLLPEVYLPSLWEVIKGRGEEKFFGSDDALAIQDELSKHCHLLSLTHLKS